ncbi:MAG: SusC/RagA family TonB-linked outer membrane protein [Chitinophagaceae bacterium]
MKKTRLFIKSFFVVMNIAIAQIIIAAIFSSSLLANDGKAQSVLEKSISLKINNMELYKIFQIIEKHTKAIFNYSSNSINVDNKISYKAQNKKVKEVLDDILTPFSIGYKEVNGQIVLYPSKQEKAIVESPGKNESFASFMVADTAISGVVTDETGNVLEGVTIKVNENGAMSLSRRNGAYTITVPSLNATLEFSYVGFTAQQVRLNGNRKINISLKTEAKALSDVVVTALGISRQKRSLGYAVADVKGAELTNGGSSNFVKSLDGRMSGVNFTQASTDPAGSVFVTIRGATSLSLPNSTVNSQPLYIIDGIPLGTASITNKNGVDFGNLLSQLNPEDIESVSVLKGASAGALYGSQAGNGVIMITTKSGKAGKKGIGVSFNTSIVRDQPYNFFETQTDYGVGIRSSVYVAGGGYDWGPKLDGAFKVSRWNTLTQTNDSVPFLATRENRLKEFMQKGSTQNYNISVTGNSDKGSFRFSVGKMSNVGVMPNNSTDRMTVNLNAIYNITKKVKISVSSNYVSQYSPNKSSSNNDAVELLTFSFLAHFQPVKEMQNIWLKGFEGIRQNAPAYKPNGDPYGNNPYMYAYGEINTYRKDNFFGKAELEWQLSTPLKLLLRSGMDFNGDNYEYKLSKGFESVAQKDGRYTVQTQNTYSVNSDVMLIWNKDFKKFSTSATAGYNYVYGNSYNYNANADKLVRANDFSLGNAVAGTLTASNSWAIGKTQSGYVTTQIGYSNQLYLDLAGRYDQSGVLEEDKNHHFYPSAALSWVASETVKLPSFINLFKLRGGTAQVGHGIGKPRSNNTFSFNPVDYGAVKILNIGGTLVDPNIKAEVTNSYEGGFDLMLLNRRISAEFTFFKKTHDNQQDFIPTSPGTGYGGMLSNVGTVEAKGIEMGLTVIPVKTKNWSWDISAFYTKTDAHITKLSKTYIPNGYTFYNNGPNVTIRMAEGDRIGSLWESNVFQRMPATSKYAGMMVLDNTGVWKYSTMEKDRKSIGNYNPDYILGLNSSVRYKAFKLSVVASLRVGGQYVSNVTRRSVTNGHSLLTIGDLVNGPNDYTVGGRDAQTGGLKWPAWQSMKFPYMQALVKNYAFYGAYAQDASYFKGVWLKPGGDPKNDADYIVNGEDSLATFYGLPGQVLGSQYWSFPQTLIRDATNLKVKEIVLEYAIPFSFLQRYKMQNLTIGFVARNIFQWNKSGEKGDPEAAFEGIGVNQGIIGKALPSIASYGFKLSVTF